MLCLSSLINSEDQSNSRRHFRPKKRLKVTSNGETDGVEYPVVVRREDEREGSGQVLSSTDDWPIGPPGYGFPRELSNLDGLLIRATGDGSTTSPSFIPH